VQNLIFYSSFTASKQRAMLEQAGLTSGAVIIVLIVVSVCFYMYVRTRRKSFDSRLVFLHYYPVFKLVSRFSNNFGSSVYNF